MWLLGTMAYSGSCYTGEFENNPGARQREPRLKNCERHEDLCFSFYSRDGYTTEGRTTRYLPALGFWNMEFEKSSLMNPIFCLFHTPILQATQAVKI